MSDHEASREAFEARHPGTIERDSEGLYLNWDTFFQWEDWKAALDYAASRECVWTASDVTEGLCDYESACNKEYAFDHIPDIATHPHCPGCGGRVKIQTNDN